MENPGMQSMIFRSGSRFTMEIHGMQSMIFRNGPETIESLRKTMERNPYYSREVQSGVPWSVRFPRIAWTVSSLALGTQNS